LPRPPTGCILLADPPLGDSGEAGRRNLQLGNPEVSPRPFPSGIGGIELTYDQEGRTVASGNRGASFAQIGEGPYALVLRARSPAGDIALKIQREESPGLNPEAVDRFKREFEALTRYGGEEPGLVAVEPIPGFEGDDGPPLFEPLVLCREKGILFHLPCPNCMRVHTLAGCRDDEALKAAGVPPFSQSGERFLWCSACGREQPAFYTRRARKGPGPVEDFVGLVHALKRVVDRGDDDAPIPNELLAGLESEFPCQTCEHRAACFPRGDESQALAEARLLPLVLNEFYAWPLPLCQLRFDEAADLLSGAQASDLVKRHAKTWGTPAVRRMKDEVLSMGAPRTPEESLAAKLDLFVQAAHSVHRLHTVSGLPHLALSPSHVLVSVGEGTAPMVRLVAPESAERVMGLNLPPEAPEPPYAAPELADNPFGREFAARILVHKVWSGPGDTFFAAEVQSDACAPDLLNEKDQLKLKLNVPGWEETEIWAHALPGASADGGISVATAPAALDEMQVNDLKSAKGQSALFGTVTLYRDFGVPFDIHALGMLLFRTLLTNELQSWDRVQTDLVEPLRASLELFAATRQDPSFEEYHEMLSEEFTREPCSRLADPVNLRNRPDDCDAGLVPVTTWHRILIIGLQAITHLKGFSYCESDRDTFMGDPGVPTLNMLGDLEQVSAEVAAALNERPEPVDSDAPHVMVDFEDEKVHDVAPLTDSVVEDFTREISGEFEEEIQTLREQLIRQERALEALEVTWRRMYEGVTGLPDKEGAPADLDDPRIGLLVATVEESIECVTQISKSISRFGGDELGESAPKIRVLIQNALFESEGDPAKKEKKIKRQLRALGMSLFGTLKTFLEAHSHSTKLGTRSLLRLLEKGLFDPVVKGKKERAPDADEIRRRFDTLAGSLPEKHHRVFQPFFQEYVKNKFTNLK